MFSFYTIVTIIAIVLLIIALTIIGLSIKNNVRTNKFPDYQYTCPDFWNLSSDSKICMAPPNVNNPQVQTTSGGYPNKYSLRPDGQRLDGVRLNTEGDRIVSIDISSEIWPSTCSKVKWSKTNKILWDGITQSNECP